MSNQSENPTIKLGGDLTVSRLGYGSMRNTGAGIWGDHADRDSQKRVLQRAVELGVNFIDTADSYGPGSSETLIGEALHPYAKGTIIATKAGLVRTGPNEWFPLGRPEYLVQQLHLSLRRLRVETIDLWQLHRVDPLVPIEESLGPIVDLQRQGKIRHIGLSEVSVAEIERARKVANIVSVQNEYNLGNRKYEDVLAYCEEHGIAFIPWFPVAAGSLAQAGGPLDSLAATHGVSVAQLSLAWLLQHSPVLLPIPGTSSIKHLEENIKAQALKLSAGEWKEVEALAPAIKPYY
ncbi:aldo/keto reductase [Duganella aceris]|uniref:Aldo/keto reductase n=1 Tax=Duganella aceris TaxID=2703883 RepID=A0ABX0FKM8_9BURK|nr:aldo/keto reductase [Duganella aceris]NGZ85081.1 aldo/keto reductase [Duganella aceris]